MEDLHSIAIMQLLPVITKGDTGDCLKKKYVTRTRQAKTENVTTQSLRVDSFGDKVVKEALALSPTTSSTKNGGYMMTVHYMGMVVTEEKSEMPTDEKSLEVPVVEL